MSVELSTGKMTHPQLNVLEADTGEQLAHHDGRLRQDDLVFPAGHRKGMDDLLEEDQSESVAGKIAHPCTSSHRLII